MRETLHVRWHVAPRDAPRPWLHCARCGTRTPFVSSRKFRVNAQKKRLDAWLIYRCTRCDQTWNCPILERRRVAEIDPATLRSMTANDPELARCVAFDLRLLGRHAARIEPGAGAAVVKHLSGAPVAAPRLIVIAIDMKLPCGIRLDRLLSVELGLSRDDIRRLHDAAALTVSPSGRAALKQSARDGQAATLHMPRLVGPPDRRAAILGRVV